MLHRKLKTVLFIQILLATSLASCVRPTPQPVLASWSEQYLSAKKIVNGLGNEFVLVEVVTHPIRNELVTSHDPIELKTILVFKSLKSNGATGDPPNYYDTQIVEYNDHHLAETLTADHVIPNRYAPPPASVDRAAMLQISPQDALQLTITEGEAYMEEPVYAGNTDIDLVWDVSESHPELKDVLTPAWQVLYAHKDHVLNILIDAQTGEILKRYEEPNS